MAKLYELAEGYKNIQALLDNPDIPEEIVIDSLTSINEDFEDKAESIAKLLKSMEADVKAFKEEEIRLSSRRKALENRIGGLKTYLESYMRSVDKPKFKGKLFTFSIQKNKPSVDISNIESIPIEYIEVEEVKKVDKKKILADIQEGKEVPGASVKVSESLRIR